VKTIGVLGGLGPQATMDFERRVHRVAQQLIPQNGNQGYPPMVVSYFREPPIVLPPGGALGTTLPPVNPRLLETARRLGAWADFLVITANGVHAFQDEIERAAGCKVLSMVDVTVDEVRRRNLKHVGIVDFRPSQLSVYPRPLEQAGIRWDALPDDMHPALYQAVQAVSEGRTGREENQIASAGLAHLRAQNVDGIILACTEIPFMLDEPHTEADIINPLALLAEATVRFAMQ
jgi:aspartate racemase